MRERREGKKGESFCVVVVRTEKEEEECGVFATWPYRLILGFGFWMRKQPMVFKV